ncbi:hypothetical protein KDD17_05110 [Sulfitobacter albidus]|uniref:Uncharacterized protein n=1 Tax=Sulfitobacter albidus TaxID=2829501 RepID=A0A975JF54_9RHOB|nr:hypothetical protein [Sulfitobacter albidus]QUJ77379.1 hypothetical protein KDD17_05110 [Sulfitobacter albidus]
MSVGQVSSLVQRKARSGRESYDARAMTLARALRLTLARTAERRMALSVSVIGQTRSTVRGVDVAAALGDDLLLLLLEGGAGRVGLAALDADLAMGLVQAQTTGRIKPAEMNRPFTATDAALCAPLVEDLLTNGAPLPDDAREGALLAGWRFGVRADGLRTACLALDMPDYDVLTLSLDLAAGAGRGG